VRPNIAEQHGPRQTLDGPQVHGIVDLDFDHMHAVVDRHFSDAEADLVFATPIWSTPTDSLLGLNFNLSQTQQ